MDVKEKMQMAAAMEIIFITTVWRTRNPKRSHHISPKSRKKRLLLGRRI